MSSHRFSITHAFRDAIPASWRRRLAERFNRWVERRGPTRPPLVLGYRQIFILPTRFGALTGVLLLAMLLGSLNFNNNLGLLTTFLIAGVGLLSMHAAHRNLDGLEILQCTADETFAGAPMRLSVIIRDTRGRAREGIVAVLPGQPPAPGTTLEPFGTGVMKIDIPTVRRGWLDPPRIRIRTRHPLGWFEAWSWFRPGQRFLVWPRPVDAAPPLPAPRDGTGRHRPGDESDEFHGLRDWREGDPLHRIAWKASQRHQQLLARQFTRPESERLILRLADAPDGSTERQIAVVARWVLEAERRGNEYGLALPGRSIPPDRGPAHRARCLDALAECR